MAEFQPINIAENYLAGKGIRQREQANALAMRAGEQDIADRQQRNALAQQQLTDEQRKQFATMMVQAAQYGIKSPTPKAFIESNYPQLVQLAGPEWATSNDEQVRAKLQEAIGIYGPIAGIGPPEAKGVGGALYQYVGDDGNPLYGNAETAVGKRPYHAPPQVLPSFSPVQTEAGVGAFNSRTGTVTNTGVKPPEKAPEAPKLTEADKKVRVLLSSMENAERDIANLKDVDTGSLFQAALGSNRVTAPMQSDAFRKYEAAGLRWAANLLYIKSGATATPDEIRSTWKQFFPQPGEGEEVKAQKAASRAQEVAAIKSSYGGGVAPAAPPAAPPPPAAPAAPANRQPVQVKSDAEYAALPSGTQYVAPDGSVRVKR